MSTSASWNSDSAHSSTSSHSSRYNIREGDTGDVFVYQYGHGCEVIPVRDLCEKLDKDPNRAYRISRKPIPRGNSRVEVRFNDTFNEPEKSKYADYPNQQSSMASVGLPSQVYWRRLLLNQFQDLYIVSPESSPRSSLNSSEESSKGITKSNTMDPMRPKHIIVERSRIFAGARKAARIGSQ